MVDQKEKNLLLKIRELMFRLGIKSLTMDDIAQNLGISKKTLYLVVANKAELVDKVMDIALDEQRIACEGFMEQRGNAIDQLLKMYAQNSKMMGGINPSLIFELNKYYPESWNKLFAFRNEFIFNAVRANMEHGIASGWYRKDIDIDIIAKLYTSRALDIFNQDMFPPSQYPGKLVFRQMFIYHARGIASDKGLRYLEKELAVEF
jgi:AcrR family transcriptional regulator